MIVETGHFALILALALAIVNAIVPLVGHVRRDGRLIAVAPSVALMGFAFTALAFGALTYAHVVSDFSVVNVIENSSSTKPLIYKITGVWGNHEGSMLLWVMILAIFAAAVAVASRGMPADLRALVLCVQSWIASAFLLFILLTSDPFTRTLSPPIQGQDLNPLLQDPGLAIHPPLLYLGYVGFSMTFSFAAAALIAGRVDAAWARFVRPWTLIAWIFLTLGIAMGSYWAYYTLGWGGFWFWDPVENASLMPWLAGTALLHSAVVMEKREALKVWTIFLAILAFSLSLVGTFLVRSGVLTSVHAFATDPKRGFFILVILFVFIGGSLALFAWRAGSLRQGGLFAPVSREGALVLNNLLITAGCATVLVGTLYPLALESLTGQKISVGAPFFNATFVPLAIPVFLAMPIGSSLAWKRGDLLGAAQRLMLAIIAGALAVLAFALYEGAPARSYALAGLAVFVIAGSVLDVGRRIAAGGLANATSRALGLPRSAYGTAIAHAGLGLTLLGLAAAGWGQENILTMTPGQTAAVGPFTATLEGISRENGPNYTATVAHTTIRRDGQVIATVEPASRFYTLRAMPRAEAGIVTVDLGQFYASIGTPGEGAQSVDMKLFWKPLVTLIWIGALVMGFGGALSLSDRRLRFGVAARARRPRTAAVPAE
ncbi:heme lyase, CcmF subunit [Beijerinckiaceae bacterium RH AL1]|nr:heme lyase CcmF/NrfE family subunit [Beijerinckiaceae bacterium]VVB45204.1 heme lyase, CcmF subunit [Beijerinckiaceae bacterium RH CH11]VVB45282.1 heme lyase, CcmF subunit [Beijerinckiaceae bacterium RH AL8]VVC54748.1 heme lyase, CcmF subunit [Beijerinckiaceae bacterium RH AL1]